MKQKKLAPLELYRVLPGTNCGLCLLPTCLAFSAAVVAGRKKLTDCPSLGKEDIARLSGSLVQRTSLDLGQAEFMDRLERKIAELDLARIAPVIGARFHNNTLTVNSLGKEFHIDRQGRVTSECHIIPWVKAPLLSYVTNEKHMDITGSWISFRELQGGMDWQGLFTSRCEIVLKKLADEHPDLLGDIIDLFMGIPTTEFQADIGLILHPLPHIPILICYQAPDEDLESELTIFFDACCGVNLHIKSIFTLCSGLVQMFDKIARLHR
ncbi:MAG: DUF3786 domain-containing protein [Desulfobulbaceae bacterium]|nr:DUF3786 domain-containing protein [Desulfobulbaceae bacterium]